MSTDKQLTELEKLTETVLHLKETMNQKERNYEHLAKLVRWGVLGFIAAIVMVGVVITDRIGTAYAQTDDGLNQAKGVVEALNNINDNLALFGMLGQTIQQAKPAIQNAMMNNSDVQKHVQSYLAEKGLQVNEENMRKYATPAIVESAMTTMIDTVVLMQRIRQDSNKFRDMVGGPGPAISAIRDELRLINLALVSVPAMAVQMDIMNFHMSRMSYSMHTTLGRVGDWTPW